MVYLPNAIHFSQRPLQVEVVPSQGSPVSIHLAPFVLGETSPKLVEQNPATNGPVPGMESAPLISFSKAYAA